MDGERLALGSRNEHDRVDASELVIAHREEQLVDLPDKVRQSVFQVAAYLSPARWRYVEEAVADVPDGAVPMLRSDLFA